MTPKIDVGVDDKEAAARNRQRVAKKENILGYEEIEREVQHTPHKRKIRPELKGELPVVSKQDWKQFGGEQTWVFEDAELWRTLESIVGKIETLKDTEDLTEDTGNVVE